MTHLLCIGGDDHALRIPFIRALQARGMRVTAAGTGDPGPFKKSSIEFRPLRCYRFINPIADLKSIGMFAKLLEDVNPDIVQTFNTKPNILVPFAARNFPSIEVVRTINGLAYTYSSRTPLALAIRPIYRSLHWLAARFTASTVFQNKEDKAFFERAGMTGNSLSRLIPGSGIDPEAFERARSAGPTPAQLRKELQLGDAEVVITVTRMTRHKGIPALLEAAKIVHEKRPGVRFLLAGPRESEGPLAVGQDEIDRHAPYVKALGWRSDVPSLLGVADLFVFPTEYREGVPRAMLEASLGRLPIIATRMPGCRDVVRDGWNGILVPPKNPRVLADRIIELLEDRDAARVMGERAAAVVEKEFNLNLTVSRYMDLYLEVMRRGRRASVGVSGKNDTDEVLTSQVARSAEAKASRS